MWAEAVYFGAIGAVIGTGAGWLLGYMHGQLTARWIWWYVRHQSR